MGPSVNPAVILLLAGAAVTLILIGIGVALILARRRKGRPACGACGYAVAGLQALKCPECGSDLREVGIKGGRAA